MKTLLRLISLLAILLVALPGPLYKFEILTLTPAFTAMRYEVYLGIIAIVLLLIQVIFMRKTISLANAGISALLAIVAVALPVSMMSKAKSVPPIHDISTDLLNPPKFDAIATLRNDAPNPVEYAGEETAKQQRRAYPYLSTKHFTLSTSEVFDVAMSSVNALGWEPVNVDKSAGIIEATDTTVWFGFKDDVVIRIVQTAQGANMDVRSKSRVGRSDLGKNAQRISSFIADVEKKL